MKRFDRPGAVASSSSSTSSSATPKKNTTHAEETPTHGQAPTTPTYSASHCSSCHRHAVSRSSHAHPSSPFLHPSHHHNINQERRRMKGGLFTFALWGVLFALVPFAVDYATRKEFPVHSSGAIIITGASTGIGNHAAIHLATQHPLTTIYAGIRKDKDAEAITALNLPNLLPLKIDTTDQDSMDAAIAQVLSTETTIIGLVNNAGVSNNSPLEFLSMPKLRQLLETNVIGPTYLTQKLTPALRASQGRVVQISSVLGLATLPTRGAYCASKHAFEALSDVFRLELANFGVSVSVVEPAYVKTEIFGKVQQDIDEMKSAELMGLYGSLYYRPDQAEKKQKQIEGGDSPVVTSEAIEHALFSSYPKTRYVVANFAGVPADLCVYFNWLMPDRLMDLAKAKMI